MGRLTPEAKNYIDAELKSEKGQSYTRLIRAIGKKYGLKVSKGTISKRAKALNIQRATGRKRRSRLKNQPAHTVFIDYAGACFLKAAEIEMGLLVAMGEFLTPSSDTAQAHRAMKLAQRINAVLLYAPIFGLEKTQDFLDYNRRGLFYLAEQKQLPSAKEMRQYLRFLTVNKLLPLAIKEVAKLSLEALFVRIDCAGESFYLDAQLRTVWPSPKIPPYFSTTLNKTIGYVNTAFKNPSPKRPLILQACPGYTALPPEMFNFIQCCEQAADEPIARITAGTKSAETIKVWPQIEPAGKCYFLAPLSPWQYAQLQGTEIIRDFRQYRIGPEKEQMAVADAKIKLFNPQLKTNIIVRAALIRRKDLSAGRQEERLALITNISRRQERYIRRIADLYFFRWPQAKLNTYYDLMEQAHEEMLGRSQTPSIATPLMTVGYSKSPLAGFKFLLELLHRYCLRHYFPAGFAQEDLSSLRERVYRQGGFLKIKQRFYELFLHPFADKKLHSEIQLACQKINQSGIKFNDQRTLRIHLQSRL
jgi:hypothetical protein